MRNKTLHIVTSATGAARRLNELVQPAIADGWDVWVIGTPNSAAFLDTVLLEKLTGHSVEFYYRKPGEPRIRPSADAVIAAGVSFNTINKWALGLADNLALSLLCEMPSYDIPVVLLPFLNEPMAKHPSLLHSYAVLEGMGVKLIADRLGNAPHPANKGSLYLKTYPWHLALSAIRH
jgi:phosphopantothenoylcysteine synthetase/decarboxylase